MGRDKKYLKILSAAAAAIGAAGAAAAAYAAAAFRAVAKRRSVINREEDGCRNSVFIRSFDGLKLAGHWLPADEPKRIVIAMHGWRSSWERDFGGMTGFLNRCGCSVLFPDQRSHGGSEGSYISYGILERRDVVSWAEYIKDAHGEELPVYLFGISMGAATVLMTAGLEFPVRIHGIIADCGYTSPEDIIKTTAKNNRLPSKLTYPVVDRRFERKLGHSFSELYIPELLKSSSVPTLFIHGDADGFVPLEMTVENYNACSAPKELLVVGGAAHAKSYSTAPEKYERAVLDFFAKYDRYSGGTKIC